MTIYKGALEKIREHARREAPAECCGVLIGSGDRITDAWPARNLSASPDRFVVDPQDHIAARREARSRALDVVGFYHSHPHSVARPSPTDLAEASYVEGVHLIVSLASDPADARLFRMFEAGFEEIPFEIY